MFHQSQNQISKSQPFLHTASPHPPTWVTNRCKPPECFPPFSSHLISFCSSLSSWPPARQEQERQGNKRMRPPALSASPAASPKLSFSHRPPLDEQPRVNAVFSVSSNSSLPLLNDLCHHPHASLLCLCQTERGPTKRSSTTAFWGRGGNRR